MRKKPIVGPVSLTIAAIGAIICEVFLFPGLLTQGWQQVTLRIIATGFEAALIGGLADWYAVHVLFRPAPAALRWIPFVRKHSNIVVSKRQDIADGVVDMVQNKWLTPANIKEHLATISPSMLALNYLDEEPNKKQVLGLARMLLSHIVRDLDNPELVATFANILRDQVKDMRAGKTIGTEIKRAMEQGDHDALWSSLLQFGLASRLSGN